MEFTFNLISGPAYIEWPHNLIGWISLGVFTATLGYLWWSIKDNDRTEGGMRKLWLFIFILLVPLTNLFLGIRLPNSQITNRSDFPFANPEALAMLFSAIPWMLAAGIHGPRTAAAIAFASSSLRIPWETHNPFTPIVYALIAVFYSWSIRQRYRTSFYRWLRQPIFAAILNTLAFSLLYLISTPFLYQDDLISQLNYTISSVGVITTVRGIEWLAGSIFITLVKPALHKLWVRRSSLLPSPGERSLKIRAFTFLSFLIIALAVTMIFGVSTAAIQTEKENLINNLSDDAAEAAENIPYFLETGQNLLMLLASDFPFQGKDQLQILQMLEEKIKVIPFFDQLTLYNDANQVIASYPDDALTGSNAIEEEIIARQNILMGVPFQLAAERPTHDQKTAQISFIHGITDEEGTPIGILVGRTHLSSYPLIQHTLETLESSVGENGIAIILDEENRILFHKYPTYILSVYESRLPEGEPLFEEVSSDGNRYFVYQRETEGRDWTILLKIRKQIIQQRALGKTVPYVGLILIVALISFGLVQWNLRSFTKPLDTLSRQATAIAEGRLDQPLPIEGVDEIGQLRQAFERMRVQLKKRLAEANQLQQVSQSVASSLEIAESVQPILEAVMSTGAQVARVVLLPNSLPGYTSQGDAPLCFGLGAGPDQYSYLDQQILTLTQHQDRLVLADINRPRLVDFPPASPKPQSLFAVALRHEEDYYGALWAAYNQAHTFSEEEVRFLVTLGGYAAIAATNTRLYQTTESERKRLNAIIQSSPDPLLVVDENGFMLFSNPAMQQLLGIHKDFSKATPFEKAIKNSQIVNLLRFGSSEANPTEIAFPNGHTYLANVKPIMVNKQLKGRMCILRDITYFKELERLKSDFLTTVSHELGKPLKEIKGNAKILSSLGKLNDEQLMFVNRITSETDSLIHLTENLLSIERIERGIVLKLEEVSIPDLLSELMTTFQIPARQKNIRMRVDKPAGPLPSILADRELLQRALYNLVDNAVKFSRRDGEVVLRARAQTKSVIFEVVDNGIGISPMDLEHIFERYYHGKPRIPGERIGGGLGLAIVKSIADLHKGRVRVESKLGSGSAFYLEIPIMKKKRENSG